MFLSGRRWGESADKKRSLVSGDDTSVGIIDMHLSVSLVSFQVSYIWNQIGLNLEYRKYQSIDGASANRPIAIWL